MAVALVTGSGGLIGSESVRRLLKEGFLVIGIDNNMRSYFFGEEASIEWQVDQLRSENTNYRHFSIDIRDSPSLETVFREYNHDIKLIVHCAAQPSHDWAARDPQTDFSINANGTLNLLELARQNCDQAVFIFTSTNKVYGDTPNLLPLVEMDTRFEVDESHVYSKHGIDESMSIDRSKHSLFGASKAAADILVQEYGRYWGLKTVCFRGGCLTGPGHAGAELHGFLSYLVKCVLTGMEYTIYGYGGKQVRDNIHCSDLLECFWHFYMNPHAGEVYNIGGSRQINSSLREAVSMCEDITGKKLKTRYVDRNRSGDHIWWISDIRRFRSHYPQWEFKYDLRSILEEIAVGLDKRLN